MAIIFGPDAFTVGANQNLDTYPTGAPNYAMSRGASADQFIDNTTDVVKPNGTTTSVARVTAIPVMANQEVSSENVVCSNTEGEGLCLRYSTSTRGYVGELALGVVNEVIILEDNAGLTTLASADRGLTTGNNSITFRAVGTTGGTFLTLICSGVTALTFTDTTAPADGQPGIYFDAFGTGTISVDNLQVDDIKEYPQTAGIATTSGSTAATSCTVNMPSGIQANDLLIVVHRAAAGGTITFPNEGNSSTGWVQLFEDSSDASDDTTACAWRRADGGEGSTITITQGTSGKFASIVYRISNAANPLIQPPEFATLVTGTSTTPDPGTVTPTGGSKPYMFLWVGAWAGEQTTPPANTPTNYNIVAGISSGTGGATATNCQIATAQRQVTASSENPGSWTISASDSWTATVIAVHPSVLDQCEYGRPDGQVGQSQMKQILVH